MHVDLLIINAAQVVTCRSYGGPKRGGDMADVGVIRNGAVAVVDGRIVDVGDSDDLVAKYDARDWIDAAGKAVCPGFVDPHTHTVYGGERVDEFELRIRNATYMEIMAAGGGILSTMRRTRSASDAELVHSARLRLDQMLRLGTTTVEIKTGYGLDIDSEIKMLRVIEALARQHTCDIMPTFLGAHTIPPEFAGDADAYTRFVIEEMWPAVLSWYRSSDFAAKDVPIFVDVFCEEHAFDVEQSERVLRAGAEAGCGAKIHVDQFHAMGGVEMALELGAISVDHLDVSGPGEIDKIAQSNTIATPLPAASFNLASESYANARAMIDSGCAVALATDLNPGSAPCPSMPLVMAIACRYQKLSPAEALNAATINAAHAIGLGDRIGSLEAGKQADILILAASDYRHIPYYFGGSPVEIVIKRGRIV